MFTRDNNSSNKYFFLIKKKNKKIKKIKNKNKNFTFNEPTDPNPITCFTPNFLKAAAMANLGMR